MKTKTAKVLPKTVEEITNGGVYLQRVRCGKQNCRCARGDFHTAFYFFTRIDGKLVKRYVRKAEVERLTELAETASEKRKHLRQVKKSDLKLLKQLCQNLRENNLLINNLKGDYQK